MSEKQDSAVRSIFKGGMIIFIGTIASKIMALLYRIVVGRLGPEFYGIISVMMSTFSVAVLVACMGIPQGVHKYVSQYLETGQEAKARGTIRAGLTINTVSTILVALILFFSAPWIVRNVFHEPRALIPVRMIAVVIPFRAYHSIALSVTNAFERMEFHVYTERLWNNAVQLVLAAVLVYLGFGYLGAAFAYAFAFFSAAFLSLYFANSIFPGILSSKREVETEYYELLSHSMPLLAGGLFGVITGYIDTFMLQFFKGSSSVGLYKSAYPFAKLLMVGVGIFSSIFLSNASKLTSGGDKSDLAAVYRSVVKWVSLLSVPIFAIIFAFPRTVLVLFGSEYYAAENVLRVLAVGFLLNSSVGPANRIYESLGITQYNFMISVVLAVSNFVLNLLLIPELGVMGAAIASTASFTLLFLIHMFLSLKLLGKLPFRSSVLKTWIAALVSMGFVYLLTNLLFDFTPVWFYVLALMLFGGLYISLLLAFRTIDRSDIVVLRALKDKTGIEVEWLESLVRKYS